MEKNPSGSKSTVLINQNLKLLMEEVLHQLRLVVYPIIYQVLYIPGGDRRIWSINSSGTANAQEVLSGLQSNEANLESSKSLRSKELTTTACAVSNGENDGSLIFELEVVCFTISRGSLKKI